MADRVLMISWGNAVRGREERSLEVFNEAVGLWGRMQQEGRIESFDLAIFAPNADLNGYMAARGSSEQLHAVRESEDYQALIADALLCVDRLRVTEGVINEGIARQVAIYQEAVAKVPQTA
jgi:hypothetical protein